MSESLSSAALRADAAFTPTNGPSNEIESTQRKKHSTKHSTHLNTHRSNRRRCSTPEWPPPSVCRHLATPLPSTSISNRDVMPTRSLRTSHTFLEIKFRIKFFFLVFWCYSKNFCRPFRLSCQLVHQTTYPKQQHDYDEITLYRQTMLRRHHPPFDA